MEKTLLLLLVGAILMVVVSARSVKSMYRAPSIFNDYVRRHLYRLQKRSSPEEEAEWQQFCTNVWGFSIKQICSNICHESSDYNQVITACNATWSQDSEKITKLSTCTDACNEEKKWCVDNWLEKKKDIMCDDCDMEGSEWDNLKMIKCYERYAKKHKDFAFGCTEKCRAELCLSDFEDNKEALCNDCDKTIEAWNHCSDIWDNDVTTRIEMSTCRKPCDAYIKKKYMSIENILLCRSIMAKYKDELCNDCDRKMEWWNQCSRIWDANDVMGIFCLARCSPNSTEGKDKLPFVSKLERDEKDTDTDYTYDHMYCMSLMNTLKNELCNDCEKKEYVETWTRCSVIWNNDAATRSELRTCQAKCSPNSTEMLMNLMNGKRKDNLPFVSKREQYRRRDFRARVDRRDDRRDESMFGKAEERYRYPF